MATSLFLSNAEGAEPGPGTLKAFFFYKGQDIPAELRAHCPPPGETEAAGFAAIATDIAVSLAGKAVDSLIDAVAARTQPEVTTLDIVIPIDGFFTEKGAVAIAGGCLLFHNGKHPDASEASLLMSLQVVPSPDATAFRFDVYKWEFNRFLKPQTGGWFQKAEVRDLALKIEFLTPGSSGLGARSVFVEHMFQGVTAGALTKVFFKDQKLPWLAAPTKPSLPTAAPPGAYGPLNVRITVVESTKPNQFALWLHDLAKEKKADIATAVKDAVRRSIDPSAAATEQAKLAESAGTAYAAYKTAWDDGMQHKSTKPKAPDAGADEPTKEKYRATLAAWQGLLTVKVQNVSAKKTLARSAFQTADLPWPGDLPSLVE